MFESKMEVTQLLHKLGDPGLYQVILYVALWLCNSTVCMNHLIMAVYGYTPPHSCKIPEGMWKNITIPMEEKDGKNVFSKCQVYSNFTKNSSRIDCSNGWVFDLTRKESSIVNEWSLVCDDKYLVGTSTTIYFAGVMVGGAIFGQLADKFGRKPILLFCLYSHIILGVIIYFVTSFEGFVTSRFFSGFVIQGVQTSSYVLLVEMTVLKYRPLCAGMFEVFWAVGNLWMATLAWIIQDWRKIQLALCLPSLVTLFYIILVPESIRWLVYHNRIEEARRYIQRIASFNKTSLPENLDIYVGESSKKFDGKNYSFLDLFRTFEISKRTALMGFIWLVSSIGYYGLSLSAGGLAGNRFLNLFISAFVELLAFISVLFILKYCSRRRPLMIYYIMGGMTCIIAGTIRQRTNIENAENIAKSFAIMGKFFIAAAFSTIFLFTVELFPTPVRTLGMGSCVFWARVGGMVAPQILLLKNYSVDELPYVIFGILSLLASIAIYFIPETRGTRLPERIEDLKKLKNTECLENMNQSDTKL